MSLPDIGNSEPPSLVEGSTQLNSPDTLPVLRRQFYTPASNGEEISCRSAFSDQVWDQIRERCLCQNARTQSEKKPLVQIQCIPPRRSHTRSEISGSSRRTVLVDSSSTVSPAAFPHRAHARLPLYCSPNTDNRYRKIEDLAAFLATGVTTGDAMYFIDPVQRLMARDNERTKSTQQKISTGPVVERRFLGKWAEDDTIKDKSDEIIPRRVRIAKRKFNEIMGMVRPYALGHAYRHKLKTAPYPLIGDPIANYVMTMQSQRPTKGLYSFY
ncbi:unnamed protein product [Phytomonas sp. EM1]|nr:unnamed protein product [Phytomonas sp. EM1]|eukprot:CCW61031.1 unnamed protein product [Phytomonas sp. isolate EM1]